MKLKYLFVTALASLAIATGAQAQLGWTLEQCNAKYGEGTYHLGNYYYKVDGLELAVQETERYGDPVGRLWYFRAGKGHKMSSATIAKLLKQNALGYIWFDFPDKGWGAFASKEAEIGNEIDGGQIVAFLDDSGCYLTIARQAHVSAEVPTNGVYIHDKTPDTRSDAEKEFDAKLHGQ
jgi:hypothetical protein